MYKHFTIPNFLSEEECNSILSKCKEELTLKTARIRNQAVVLNKRKSSVAFISDLGFLNKKLQNILTYQNSFYT